MFNMSVTLNCSLSWDTGLRFSVACTHIIIDLYYVWMTYNNVSRSLCRRGMYKTRRRKGNEDEQVKVRGGWIRGYQGEEWYGGGCGAGIKVRGGWIRGYQGEEWYGGGCGAGIKVRGGWIRGYQGEEWYGGGCGAGIKVRGGWIRGYQGEEWYGGGCGAGIKVRGGWIGGIKVRVGG